VDQPAKPDQKALPDSLRRLGSGLLEGFGDRGRSNLPRSFIGKVHPNRVMRRSCRCVRICLACPTPSEKHQRKDALMPIVDEPGTAV
jgi:hypothetical protein